MSTSSSESKQKLVVLDPFLENKQRLPILQDMADRDFEAVKNHRDIDILEIRNSLVDSVGLLLKIKEGIVDSPDTYVIGGLMMDNASYLADPTVHTTTTTTQVEKRHLLFSKKVVQQRRYQNTVLLPVIDAEGAVNLPESGPDDLGHKERAITEFHKSLPEGGVPSITAFVLAHLIRNFADTTGRANIVAHANSSMAHVPVDTHVKRGDSEALLKAILRSS